MKTPALLMVLLCTTAFAGEELWVPLVETEPARDAAPVTLFAVWTDNDTWLEFAVFNQAGDIVGRWYEELDDNDTTTHNARDLFNDPPLECLPLRGVSTPFTRVDLSALLLEGVARFSIRIRKTNRCGPPVEVQPFQPRSPSPVDLQGDWFRVDRAEAFASGSPLIDGDWQSQLQYRFVDNVFPFDGTRILGFTPDPNIVVGGNTVPWQILDEDGAMVAQGRVFWSGMIMDYDISDFAPPVPFGRLIIECPTKRCRGGYTMSAEGQFSVGVPTQ